MDKQIAIDSFNGLLPRNKKELTTNTCNMDESQKHYEKRQRVQVYDSLYETLEKTN